MYVGRVGLIACSKQKLDHAAPAHLLYNSPLFKLSKAYIVRNVVIGACNVNSRNEWGILSAKYGLVMPDQVLEPYDLALSDLPRLKLERWQDWVYEQLLDKWDEGIIYTVLAGHDYRSAVKQMPMVEDPIHHWTDLRRRRGMTNKRAAMSIGVLKKEIKQRIADLNYIDNAVIKAAEAEGGYTFKRR